MRVKTLTREDIAAGLRDAGVGQSEVLMVHSSLSSFGHVEGGAEAVIQALHDAVGDEGTVAMPAFGYAFPPDRPAWDPAASPSQVGLITEVFRKWPGTRRSDQPTHSIAARGHQAGFLTRPYGNLRPYDKRGPFGKLYILGARILFLGCGLSPNSTLHACEDWADMPYLAPSKVHVRESDGSVREFFVEKTPPGHRDFYRGKEWRKAKVNRRLADRGLLSVTTIGEAEVVSIGVRELVDAVMESFADEPDFLLCEDGGCSFCTRSRRQLRAWALPPWDHLEGVEFP